MRYGGAKRRGGEFDLSSHEGGQCRTGAAVGNEVRLHLQHFCGDQMLELHVALWPVARHVEFARVFPCVLHDGTGIVEAALFLYHPDDGVDLKITDILKIVELERNVRPKGFDQDSIGFVDEEGDLKVEF